MLNRRMGSIVAVGSLGLLLIGFLGIESLLNLTPPTSRDALIHHLAVPKIWLSAEGFVETPWLITPTTP